MSNTAEQRYRLYVDYCARVAVEPLTFDLWPFMSDYVHGNWKTKE